MQVQAPPAPSGRWRQPHCSTLASTLSNTRSPVADDGCCSAHCPPSAPAPGLLRIQVPPHERGAASPIPTRPAPTHPELNWLRASTVSAVGDAAPRHHLRPMTHPLEVPARRPALGPSQATTRRRLGLRSSPPCVPVRKTTGPRSRHPWRHHQYRPTPAPSTTTIASTRPTPTTAAGPFAAPCQTRGRRCRDTRRWVVTVLPAGCRVVGCADGCGVRGPLVGVRLGPSRGLRSGLRSGLHAVNCHRCGPPAGAFAATSAAAP